MSVAHGHPYTNFYAPKTPAAALSPDFSDELAAHLKKMRSTRPLVHSITNYVSMDIMANVCCSANISPAMVHGGSSGEARELARVASAVNVNLGTCDEDWALGAKHAVEVCVERGVPWVLDPVGGGLLTYRTKAIKEILEMGGGILKGNPMEMVTCAGLFEELKGVPPTKEQVGSLGQGVDSSIGTDTVNLELLDKLASRIKGVVVMTGKHDYCTDGTNRYWVKHDVPGLQDVIATGCSIGAVVGGMAAVSSGKEEWAKASAFALAYFTVSAEEATKDAAYNRGPGSLRVGLLDILKVITDEDVGKLARIEKLP